MPATSKAQQQAIAIALHNPSKLYKRNRAILEMTKQQMEDYASTSRKGLPKKVKK